MVEMYCEESKKKVSMGCLSFIKCRGKTMFIASIFYHLGMPQHTSDTLFRIQYNCRWHALLPS